MNVRHESWQIHSRGLKGCLHYVPAIQSKILYFRLGSVPEIVAKQSRWARHVRYGR